MIVNGIPGFFPLTKINSRLEGYYLDAKGELYSTKQYVNPRLMKGTQTPSGSYYSLTQKQAGKGFNNFPLTISASELIRQSKAHADFAAETKAGQSVIEKQPTKATPAGPRDHATSTKTGIAVRGYVIARLEGEAMVFGSKPVIHTSLTSVKAEVLRLAEKSPGKTIVYLKIEGAAIANGIAWV